jgi:hypothetical protein
MSWSDAVQDLKAQRLRMRATVLSPTACAGRSGGGRVLLQKPRPGKPMRGPAVRVQVSCRGGTTRLDDLTTGSRHQPGYCPDARVPGRYQPRLAGSVRAFGLSCKAADRIIRAARPACKTPDYAPPCRVGSFRCTLAGEPAVSIVPIQCVDGDQRVKWSWSVA